MSKYIPIIYSTPMVQSIQAKRKTKTRRVIKPQPVQRDFVGNVTGKMVKGWQIPGTDKFWQVDDTPDTRFLKCPYGQPGDILWVRESYCPGYFDDGAHAYKADWNSTAAEYVSEPKWKPSIHMPKSACQIFLHVKSVRVERLQNISEQDAIAEGINCIGENEIVGGESYAGKWYENYGKNGYVYLKPIDSFCSLWQSIYGEQSWNSNPWVWVIEFEQCERPTDFLTDQPTSHERK